MMKREASEVVSFVSPVTLLPVPFIMATLAQGAFGEETLGLGLRQTIRALRPHGETLLLGESLHLFHVAGATLIIGGLILATRPKSKA